YSEYCRLAWSKEGDKLAVFRSDHVLIISRDGLLLSNISQVTVAGLNGGWVDPAPGNPRHYNVRGWERAVESH
ncbi:MAG: hypothetical protein DRN06_08845, partial [Thermoprotei archaeon]